MASSKPRLTGKLDLMAALDRGLYEVLITEALERRTLAIDRR